MLHAALAQTVENNLRRMGALVDVHSYGEDSLTFTMEREPVFDRQALWDYTQACVFVTAGAVPTVGLAEYGLDIDVDGTVHAVAVLSIPVTVGKQIVAALPPKATPVPVAAALPVAPTVTARKPRKGKSTPVVEDPPVTVRPDPTPDGQVFCICDANGFDVCGTDGKVRRFPNPKSAKIAAELEGLSGYSIVPAL